VNLLTSVSLSLIAAAGLAAIARRLGQPLILGYVLAGAVLGPHIGFGVVTDEASIEVISEIGLIFLLFIIGLEISVPRLLRAGRTIVVSGLLQFPICVALAWLTLGGLAAGGGRFDRLYLAVALGLSSTLIVVKLLSDKFEMGTFAGRVTLGILVFQDLWAIAFLALQPNLTDLQPGLLLRSGLAGLGLVAGAVALARWVLPGLFRWMATSPELLLVTAVGWCFLLSGAAGVGGLSHEMGALVAGMVIAAFPYGTEVVARLSGVRDFFVTLFFVSLGLKIPEPTAGLVALAVAAAAFVVASRFLAVFPIFALLRLDNRTAGVVSINLAQVSEFSLVICTLGLELGHVSQSVVSLVLYTLLATAVLSTYGILLSHPLATLFARLIGGAKFLGERRPAPAPAGEAGAEGAGPEERDLFFLGVSREGVAFLEHLERESPGMKQRIVAVDFNPEIVERLQTEGVHCHYGDISNLETLRHAGIEHASVVVSGISDWFLKGTDNSRLLRQARAVAPGARVLVTADNLDRAARLYAEGADYVLIPPVLAAEHLYGLLRDASPEALAEARRRQAAELFAKASGAAARVT
jgi:Kef-type K+ transport system membrane component KefB